MTFIVMHEDGSRRGVKGETLVWAREWWVDGCGREGWECVGGCGMGKCGWWALVGVGPLEGNFSH